jgi:translation initiation factor IF-2
MHANAQSQADALAARMGRDIIALMDAGTVPAVRSFAELPAHVDANTLGSTEAMMESMERAEFLEVFNAAVGIVDEWLAMPRA